MSDQPPTFGAWKANTSTPKNPARSPDGWTPNGDIVIPDIATVGNRGYVLVAGPRPGRQTIVIINTGANPAQIGDNAQQQNPVNLPAGSTFALDTEGAVWIRSVVGTTIDTVETWWTINVGGTSRGDLPNVAALLP